MGMGADMVVKSKRSNLARLKIDHFGLDGETEINFMEKTKNFKKPDTTPIISKPKRLLKLFTR